MGVLNNKLGATRLQIGGGKKRIDILLPRLFKMRKATPLSTIMVINGKLKDLCETTNHIISVKKELTC